MRLYFLGICGTAMGNAALLMRSMGHTVLGADSTIYPPMSEVLDRAGIEILEGFDAVRLQTLAVDLVVVGNAASRGNPEVEYLLNAASPRCTSLPQLLHDHVLAGRRSVVVAGTHGKTTTATLAAFLLEAVGADPGWLIGGIPLDLPAGAALGAGAPFVIEGDEYDSAFFDKRSKFIHYRPSVAVINNLEFDHADIFRDLEDVVRSFGHLTRIIPSNGRLIINGDDANIARLLPVPWTEVIRVGLKPENDLQIRDFGEGPTGSWFELFWRGRRWQRVEWKLHGLFNARNAAHAALAAAFANGYESPEAFSLAALAHFRGVRRRQDILYTDNDRIVMEDFAHHPTAIAAVLDSLRGAYPRCRLFACFEPRSNTARSPVFQDAFAAALRRADRIFIGAVHRRSQLEPGSCLDTWAMASQIDCDRCKAVAFASNQALGDAVEAALGEEAAVTVFFTNGSFDGIPWRVAGRLRDGDR